MKTHVIASLKKVASIVALNLFVASGAFAGTTVLNFEAPTVQPGPLTGQYGVLGVNFSGTQVGPVSSDFEFAVTPRSGTQIAYSDLGKIIANFTSSAGSVQTVTAYVSSAVDIGIYAYSASGALIKSEIVLAVSNNSQLTVTSETVPIASVEIHNHGGSFAIDDFTFTTGVTIPVCEAVNLNLYNGVYATVSTDYKTAKTAAAVRLALLKQVSLFDSSLKSDVSNKILLVQLAALKASVDCALKPSTKKSQIMLLINDLIAKTKAGQC
jgi:hypothetical protein